MTEVQKEAMHIALNSTMNTLRQAGQKQQEARPNNPSIGSYSKWQKQMSCAELKSLTQIRYSLSKYNEARCQASARLQNNNPLKTVTTVRGCPLRWKILFYKKSQDLSVQDVEQRKGDMQIRADKKQSYCCSKHHISSSLFTLLQCIIGHNHSVISIRL